MQPLRAPTAHAGAAATDHRFRTVIVRPDAPGNTRGAVTSAVQDALARIRGGGTIKAADATYTVREIWLDRPVTIEALGSARPIFDADGGAQRLGIGTPVVIRDNVIQATDTSIELYGYGTVAHRNDMNGYHRAFEGWGMDDGDLSCNWWGSAAGPTGLQPHHESRPALLNPFSTAPIAGTTRACP